MFKSKSIEPPVEISNQGIEEDMLTFSHTSSYNVNKNRLIEDIKSNSVTNDIETSVWFNFFHAFQAQNKDLHRNLIKLEEHRMELEDKRSDLESQQLLLQNDIETCLNNVRKAKSPE